MKRNGVNRIRFVAALLFAASVLGPAGDAHADFTFGEATNLGSAVNTSVEDGGPCISSDGLSLYFYSFYTGYATSAMRVATRATTEDPWTDAVRLASPVDVGASPCISFDGLSLFFESFQLGGSGGADMFVSTRPTTSDDWGAPVNLGPAINSSSLEIGPSVSADGLELYFGSDRPGGSGDWDMYVATRDTVSDSWSAPINLGPAVNSPVFEGQPCISSDGLSLVFCSNRTGGYGDSDIWIARRATRDDDWDAPVNLGPSVNTPDGESEPCLSADGRTLYFSDWYIPRAGGIGKIDLWQVPIDPVVDFNADGATDVLDALVMLENWGVVGSRSGPATTLCDIAPLPLGDRIVDAKDLLLLAEHMIESVENTTDADDIE